MNPVPGVQNQRRKHMENNAENARANVHNFMEGLMAAMEEQKTYNAKREKEICDALEQER